MITICELKMGRFCLGSVIIRALLPSLTLNTQEFQLAVVKILELVAGARSDQLMIIAGIVLAVCS